MPEDVLLRIDDKQPVVAAVVIISAVTAVGTSLSTTFTTVSGKIK